MSDAACPARYEIRIDGIVDAARFEGLRVVSDGGQTVISGWVCDQPALHGLLVTVRDLGVCLISVRRLEDGRLT